MASRRRSVTNARGFTLIEMLIVLGLVAMIGGFTIAVNLNDYRIGAFRDERSTMIIALQKARSAALNNLNLTTHGVALLPASHPDGYVIFEGTDFGSADPATFQIIRSEYPIEIESGSPTEIVFAQLSGEASCNGSECVDTAPITVLDDTRGASFQIFINEEGRISW